MSFTATNCKKFFNLAVTSFILGNVTQLRLNRKTEGSVIFYPAIPATRQTTSGVSHFSTKQPAAS